MIPVSQVIVGDDEQRGVLEVLRSGALAQGERVAELEDAFAVAHGVAHAVAVSNGTVALSAALRALGIGPGDEVITTPFSFNATLNAILETGATARFADIRDDFTVDPEAMAALVNSRTAALLPVHLYGLPADMTAISALAARHGLAIVEDAAQAHGAACGGRHVWHVRHRNVFPVRHQEHHLRRGRPGHHRRRRDRPDAATPAQPGHAGPLRLPDARLQLAAHRPAGRHRPPPGEPAQGDHRGAERQRVHVCPPG